MIQFALSSVTRYVTNGFQYPVKWLSPHPDGFVADYLTGEYPDDYNWDTPGLAADAKIFEKYREAEVIHGRWAASDTLRRLTPEL